LLHLLLRRSGLSRLPLLLLLLLLRARLSLLLRSLSLLLGHLLLVCGHSSHPQLLNVLFGGHAVLRCLCIQLFALLFGEFLGGHSSSGCFRGELLLHGSNLLRARPTWSRHVERELR
jgi:hypothetical protein